MRRNEEGKKVQRDRESRRIQLVKTNGNEKGIKQFNIFYLLFIIIVYKVKTDYLKTRGTKK